MSFPKVSKCQAWLLVINNRIYYYINWYIEAPLLLSTLTSDYHNGINEI